MPTEPTADSQEISEVPLKVVVIADDSSANRWLIPQIERHHALQTIVRPDWAAPRPKPTSGRWSVSLGARVLGRIRAQYFAPRDKSDSARLAQLLFSGDAGATPRAPIWTVPAWSINSVEVLERLSALAPDLIIVSGAPILQPNISRIARLGTLNLHFGISPDYRGMHTIIKPIRRRDFAHVGATIHFVSEGIDDGPAVVRLYPALDSDDDHVSVEAKILRIAATELNALLAWCTRSSGAVAPHGRVLSGPGVLIRFSDRTIWSDVRARLIRSGVPTTAERVERYYDG